jgi:hypothetical protein
MPYSFTMAAEGDPATTGYVFPRCGCSEGKSVSMGKEFAP